MKTLIVDSHTALNSVKSSLAQHAAETKGNPVTEENRHPKFVAGNPVNKDSVRPTEEAQVAEPARPGLNLEGTLKVVEELHRRKVHRDKLISEINNLEGFEIDLKQEDEEEDNGRNFYQGCELSIRDGKGRVFATRNATVIWTTAQMINNLFVNKLAEIEAAITLPA